MFDVLVCKDLSAGCFFYLLHNIVNKSVLSFKANEKINNCQLQYSSLSLLESLKQSLNFHKFGIMLVHLFFYPNSHCKHNRNILFYYLLLQIRKRQSSSSMIEDRFAASAREYVESLHQNSRTHLLYGKNNVLVQPVLLLFVCLSVYWVLLFCQIRFYVSLSRDKNTTLRKILNIY